MKYLIYTTLSVFILLGSMLSCKKNIFKEKRENEIALREAYLSKYHSNAKPTASGLYFIGNSTNNVIKDSDYVVVSYGGHLIQNDPKLGAIDGTLFDSASVYEPFGFQVGVGAVIQGWDEGIKLMKSGDSAKLVIPSELAYGNQDKTGQVTIPAYSTLVFYIKVHKVYKPNFKIDTIKSLKLENLYNPKVKLN